MYFETEVEAVHPFVCVMNKISEMLITVEHILYYSILKINLGYMFRPGGGHHQASANVMKLLDIKQYIARRDPERFTYGYEISLRGILLSLVYCFVIWKKVTGFVAVVVCCYG
jgi:hypothetical protein